MTGPLASPCDEGYLIRIPNGRTNHYEIQPDVAVNDPLLGDHWVGEMLAVVAGTASPDAPATRRDGA